MGSTQAKTAADKAYFTRNDSWTKTEAEAQTLDLALGAGRDFDDSLCAVSECSGLSVENAVKN